MITSFSWQDGKSLYADPTKSDQQANGHHPTGSKEKNSYDHETAANGLENLEQRDATIVGLAFSNPMQDSNNL